MSHLPADRKTASRNLAGAVHQNRQMSTDGMLERMFTALFKGLVYPQIWEDPEIDMEALAIRPGDKIVAIASGGCNVMSYLVANPASIAAIDLSHAHIALNRLKIAAATHLPSQEAFYRFFGKADEKANLEAYERHVRLHLDEDSRKYWESRGLTGKKRISMFSQDLYHHGLLGWFIGAGHRIARLYGIDPSDMLKARTLDEQRSYFDRALAPLFDKRMIRWATLKKASLFGLGIPPAQYEALAASGGGDMALVLRQRLERLACGFPLSENYFAWQAFGRSYKDLNDAGEAGPLPPYLQARHFGVIKDRANRITALNQSITDFLGGQPDKSQDCFVLLDAQDWMTDAQLNALWSQITRTARSGARVVFRTAAEPSLLPGRVENTVLDQWRYEAENSLQWTLRDRSSIYGGFHLYTLER